MQVLHLVILTIATYAAVLAIQLVDRRRLSPEVREHMWNAATWGAAVYWLQWVSLLGWFWVTRFRFDPMLSKRFPHEDASGGPPFAHRALRALLALGMGVVAIIAVWIALVGVEAILIDGLGFRKIR